MNRRPILVSVLAASSLTGRSCKCDGPTGPRVDMEEATAPLREIFAGTFAGTVADQPMTLGSGDPSTPCSDAGEAFSLSLEVAEPVCLEEDVPVPCGRVRDASFEISGAVTVGEAVTEDVIGGIWLWSTDDGLRVHDAQIAWTDERFYTHDVEATTDGFLLDELVLDGFHWTRRTSPDDAAEPAWESCWLEGR